MSQEKKGKKNKKSRPGKKARVLYTLLMLAMAAAAIAFLAMLILFNALPRELTLGLSGAAIVLFLVSTLLFLSKRRGVRITGIVFAALFMAVSVFATSFMGNTYAMLNNITGDSEVSAVSGVDVSTEPFNVYITGIDQWTKERGYDLERSDVNMIVTVSPALHKIVLTSIPRDAYIALHRTGTMDKLTHTGIYGVDETLLSVGEWLGLDFDYYVKVNFNACVDIVDAIGGIDVDSPKAFKSKISKYKYKKGINHLNGKQALYYARERAAFDGEDQNRVKNQLQVMEAVIHKITSSTTLMTSYADIMATLGDEMETNMPASDIQKLIKLQLSDMRKWDIVSQRMTGTYDMEVVASMDSSNKYSVLKVDPSAKSACLRTISDTMDPAEYELEAAEEARKKATVSNMLDDLKERIFGGDGETEDETEN